MMADPLAAWWRFLASPEALRTAMSPLELDGYLTSIVVTPRVAPILPSEWLPGLWRGEEPSQPEAARGHLRLRLPADVPGGRRQASA